MQLLVARAILAPGRRTVADGPLVMGIDETLERRRGDKIAVKSSGLRWGSLMLLAPVPWAGRVWALPFLSVLAPSERYHQERGKRHKKLTDWARQMLLQVRRWLPGRALVVVADAGYVVLNLLHWCQRLREPAILVTRLRLDAALYEPAPERRPGQNARARKVIGHLLDSVIGSRHMAAAQGMMIWTNTFHLRPPGVCATI